MEGIYRNTHTKKSRWLREKRLMAKRKETYMSYTNNYTECSKLLQLKGRGFQTRWKPYYMPLTGHTLNIKTQEG